MTTRLRLMCAAALLPAATGCGGGAARVPDVTGKQLDLAEEMLGDAGLDYDVSGGGAFGIVVRSHWQVCLQHPRPGVRARSVELVVARTCSQPPATRGVPDVVGLRLDVAERELARRRLDYEVYDESDVILRRDWTVCDQYPDPGHGADEVDLYIEHFSCEGDDDD